MKRRLICSGLVLAALPVLASPVRAQFEEPDTVSRIGLGLFGEVFFRGTRGTDPDGQEISLSGGPAFGARIEYRITRTFTLGATASYSSPDEQLKSGGDTFKPGTGVTQFQFTGEGHLRVKPNIPGYFILGGGVRRGDPDDDAVHQESFTEPLGVLGAGLQFATRRHWAGRLEFRLNFVAPADQPELDMENLETDFSIGLGVVLRP